MGSELIKKNDSEIYDSKNIVETLHDLMTKVTKDKCNPETVNAACNCASRITDLLKLHLEVQRLKSFIKK